MGGGSAVARQGNLTQLALLLIMGIAAALDFGSDALAPPGRLVPVVLGMIAVWLMTRPPLTQVGA